jgi:tetrahydromethanopterin S-methyltransferase subunit G
MNKNANCSNPADCSNPVAERIEELEARIADLKARLPKHSVPASMLIELDDLEEKLEQARAEMAQGGR